MKQELLYIWQLPQNFIGFIKSRFWRCKKKAHLTNEQLMYIKRIEKNQDVKIYVICDDCSHTTISGSSMGKYICVRLRDITFTHDIPHEYGHCIQSMWLGWFYLIVIGLPSVAGNIYCRIINDWSNYFKLPWEKQADRLGGVVRE